MTKARPSEVPVLSSSLAELPHLPRKHLVALWLKQVGRPPPKAASTSFLLRAAAYRVQEQHYGGLKRQDLRLLHKASESYAVKDTSHPHAKDDKASPALVPTAGVGQAQNKSLHPAPRGKLRATAQPVTLRPGTRLVREWQGKCHSVDVRADGFGWNGQVYRSLSAVAFAITGARWSGNRFFRL